jgi:eukaryotic-like serine/threonine-protein kinase
MTNEVDLSDLVSAPDSEVDEDTQVSPPRNGYDMRKAISFGKYMLVGKLGSGGMGVVYLARETFDEEKGVQRDLAIKTIRHDSLNASTIELFRQEAAMMAQIESDAVVQVRELGTVRGYIKESLVEMPYIAMERILGITLRSLIDQLRKKRIGCPAILAAALMRAAADGLFDLHSLRDPNGNFRRAVHRDVTPRNLMITSKGAVKVIDFGVADAGDWKRRRESVEPYGINAAYLAPELFRNGYLSNKADIFSLGLVFHELLTGESVFTSKSVFEQYAALETFSFKPIPSIPKALNDCLGRMLEMTPCWR